jgi:hypothetical protein
VQILATPLGDAAEDRPPAGAVLSWYEAPPGGKIAPRSKASPLPIAAIIAVEISGPTPGTLVNWRHLASARLRASISGDGLDTLVQAAPVFIETADQLGRSR